MAKQVLFLCTGNYYRSRFAEILFNTLARERGLDWVADSRGLAVGSDPSIIGAISRYALDGLAARGITPTNHERMPRALCKADLEQAHRVIALNRVEHLPHLEKQFPAWVERVEYWNAPDLDEMSAEDALAEIELQVRALIEELALQS